ncbi:MAG: dihydrodipicolinate synthase family protein [Armatimonadetes bacterium]|nr:dihydrodipicolinate synthase family protein [Armatimonadota bacterium]
MKELGVLVPVVTPCTRSGEPDLDGLRSVCRYVLDAGCHAIFVAGSTGRGPWFGRDDKEAICATVAETIGPDTRLFAGCMASGLTEMLENARAMAGSGAQVAVLTAPGYFVYSQREVESIFLSFADSSPLPVMIYDIPAFAGTKLDLDLVQRLSNHGNVMGFKDSSGDLDRFKTLSKVVDDPEFVVLQGKEHLLSDSIHAGASGFVVSLTHVDPGMFAELYRAARSGDSQRAARVQEVVIRLMGLLVSCFERRPETSTMFHFLNCTLRKRGICDNIVLEHEGDCPGWLAEKADEAMELCKELEAV